MTQRNCSHCGADVAAGARFCRGCGASLENPVTPRPGRRSAIVMIGVSLLLLGAGVGAGAVLLTGHGSHKADTAVLPRLTAQVAAATASIAKPSSTTTNTVTVTTTTAAASTSAPASVPAVSVPGPLDAVDAYWGAIARHDFGAAYGHLAPAAIPQSESQFVADEQSAGVQSATFHGQTVNATRSTATVDVVSLVTDDRRFGCRTWSGSYAMRNAGSGWEIARADLSVQPCATRN